MKKHIYSKTFLQELEQKIEQSNDLSFNDFEKGLWFFLCSLKWNECLRLFNQLPKIGYYKENKVNSKVNIGNINDLILINLIGENYRDYKTINS